MNYRSVVNKTGKFQGKGAFLVISQVGLGVVAIVSQYLLLKFHNQTFNKSPRQTASVARLLCRWMHRSSPAHTAGKASFLRVHRPLPTQQPHLCELAGNSCFKSVSNLPVTPTFACARRVRRTAKIITNQRNIQSNVSSSFQP